MARRICWACISFNTVSRKLRKKISDFRNSFFASLRLTVLNKSHLSEFTYFLYHFSSMCLLLYESETVKKRLTRFDLSASVEKTLLLSLVLSFFVFCDMRFPDRQSSASKNKEHSLRFASQYIWVCVTHNLNVNAFNGDFVFEYY